MHSKFADEVEKLHGVRYVLQGRNDNGLDCIGLVIYAMNRCGLNPQSRRDYTIGNENYSHDFVRYTSMSCDRIETLDELERGDIILFSGAIGQGAKHCGVYTSDGKHGKIFTHTTKPLTKVVEELLDARWRRLTHSIWRIKDNG